MYRHARAVDVSDGMIERIGTALEKWAENESHMIIAEFCSEFGIGYNYLKHFVWTYPRLANIYETTLSTLCVRWLKYARDKDNLSSHMAKIVLRYLRAYDLHARDQEIEARKEIALAETDPTRNLNIEVKDYATEKLEGVFKLKYDENVDKRRSGTKA